MHGSGQEGPLLEGTLRVLETSQAAVWSEVLAQFDGFDFYHTVDYHRLEEERLGGHGELIIYSEGTHLVALPLLFDEIRLSGRAPFGQPRLIATSVYGYVGWLATGRATLPVLGRFGRRLEEYLRARGVVSLFSRMHPLLPRQNNELLIGRVENSGSTIAIGLEAGIAAYEKGLAKGHSYEIRRLREMGCQVESDNGVRFVAEFHELYTTTMKRLQAAPSYFFSREYLEELARSRQFETRIFRAIYAGRLCAMAMFIRCGRLVQYHLSCSNYGVIKYPATKLLIDEACRWAAESGCAWMHLGGGVGGRKDSLFEFKSGFGGCRAPFNIWKCIFRDQDYFDLCDLVGQTDVGTTTYFPAFQVFGESGISSGASFGAFDKNSSQSN